MGILDIEKGSKKIIFFQVKEIGKNKEYCSKIKICK